MSTPESNMPNDVPSLQDLVKATIGRLMAHSQTVQELLKANLELRAALHMIHSDKEALEAYIKNLLNPAPVVDAPVADAPVAASDANTVQA